jgi:hypothetical protein
LQIAGFGSLDEARWKEDMSSLFESADKVKPIFMRDLSAQMSVSFDPSQIEKMRG